MVNVFIWCAVVLGVSVLVSTYLTMRWAGVRYELAIDPFRVFAEASRGINYTGAELDGGKWLAVHCKKIRYLNRYCELIEDDRSVTVAMAVSFNNAGPEGGRTDVYAYYIAAAYDPEGAGDNWKEIVSVLKLPIFSSPEEMPDLQKMVDEAVSACMGPSRISRPGGWLDDRSTDAISGSAQFEKKTVLWFQGIAFFFTTAWLAAAAASLLPVDWVTSQSTLAVMTGPHPKPDAFGSGIFIALLVGALMSSIGWGWGFLRCLNVEAHPESQGRWSLWRSVARVAGAWMGAAAYAAVFFLVFATVAVEQAPLLAVLAVLMVVGAFFWYRGWKRQRGPAI